MVQKSTKANARSRRGTSLKEAEGKWGLPNGRNFRANHHRPKRKEQNTMYVIYNDYYKGLCMTTKDNYYAPIMNERRVTPLKDFTSAEQAIEWMCKFYNDTPDRYEIVKD